MPGSAGNVTVAIVPEIEGKPESDGQRYGQQFGNAASSALDSATIAIGNILSTAVQNVASAIADTFVNAFNNYADYEQLAGGVEKIFDQANISQIMADAQAAYKDLNMSANEYLESINRVGASFAQTMGDQRGYDTARTGMKAIADYASGTGRSLDELNEKFSLITRSTSSYQSIADQFSGILPATSADFLEQAQAADILSDEYTSLTQVPIDEYQEAVSRMLEKGVDDMGLLGNTTAESATTISGSLSMLQASWQNFLTGVFDENADMGALGEQLFTSLGAVLKNVVPRLGVLISRAVLELPGAIVASIKSIPDILAPTISAVFGDELGASVSDSLGRATSKISEALSRIIAVVQGVLEKVMPLVQPVLDAVMAVVSAAMPVIEQAIDTVLSFLETYALPVVQTVVDAILPMVQELSDRVSVVAEAIMGIVSNVMSGIQAIIGAVMPGIQAVIDVALGAIRVAFDALAPVRDFVVGVFTGIKSAMEDPINTAKSVIEGAINAIKGFFNFQIQWPHIPLPHFNVSGSINPIDWLTQGPPHFSIDWYAKGGFVDGATLIGAGEKGAEMILPQQGKLLEDFAEAISDKINGGGDTFVFNITADSETTLQSLVAQAQRARIAYGRA